MIETIQELYIFFYAVWMGVMVAAVYSGVRLFRCIKKHTMKWINIEDFFFWVGSCIYLFSKMLTGNRAIIRWYFIIGVVLGVIVVNVLYLNCVNAMIKVKKYLKNRKN